MAATHLYALRLIIALVAGCGTLLLSLPALLLFLPFLAMRFVVRVGERMLEQKARDYRELAEFIPDIGWRQCQQLDTHVLASGETFQLTTDENGWRGSNDLDSSEVAVFGDSFAFGCGVDDKDYFGELCTQPRMKAIAANGYNMVQELMWMRRLADSLAGKHVVWMIYYGNDLYDNLQPNMGNYRMPFVRRREEQWEVVTEHVDETPWTIGRAPDYYRLLGEICSPSRLSERALSACDFLLSEGAQCCQAAGASLTVVTIPDSTQLSSEGMERLRVGAADPSQFDVDLPDRKLREICAGLGIPMIALKDHLHLAHYKPQDVHWNERGHREVARVLREALAAPRTAHTESGAPQVAVTS